MDAFATERVALLLVAGSGRQAMADGSAQASGKLGSGQFNVTAGVGNAMGMLYDAQKAGSPHSRDQRVQHEQSSTPPSRSLGRPSASRADGPPRGQMVIGGESLADLPRLVAPRADRDGAATGRGIPVAPATFWRPTAMSIFLLPARRRCCAARPARRIDCGPGLAAAPSAGDHGGRCGGAEPCHAELVELRKLLARLYTESCRARLRFRPRIRCFRGRLIRSTPDVRQSADI